MSLPFILITGLGLLVWGELFWVADAIQERDCHARNAHLLLEHREGPLEACQGVF